MQARVQNHRTKGTRRVFHGPDGGPCPLRSNLGQSNHMYPPLMSLKDEIDTCITHKEQNCPLLCKARVWGLFGKSSSLGFHATWGLILHGSMGLK